MPLGQGEGFMCKAAKKMGHKITVVQGVAFCERCGQMADKCTDTPCSKPGHNKKK